MFPIESLDQLIHRVWISTAQLSLHRSQKIVLSLSLFLSSLFLMMVLVELLIFVLESEILAGKKKILTGFTKARDGTFVMWSGELIHLTERLCPLSVDPHNYFVIIRLRLMNSFGTQHGWCREWGYQVPAYVETSNLSKQARVSPVWQRTNLCWFPYLQHTFLPKMTLGLVHRLWNLQALYLIFMPYLGKGRAKTGGWLLTVGRMKGKKVGVRWGQRLRVQYFV